MTKDDLRPGYLVKFRNGKLGEVIQMVQGIAIVTNPYFEFSNMLSEYSEDMILKDISFDSYDILEVYDFLDASPNIFSTERRNLLWERTEPKKMTLSAVSKALGYEIEIVEE